MTVYRALVDVALDAPRERVANLYSGGLVEGVEQIGDDQYQIVLAVRTATEAEAYRRSVNYVEAVAFAAFADYRGGTLGVTLYGPDNNEVML